MRLIGILAGVIVFVAAYVYVSDSAPKEPVLLSKTEAVSEYQLANGMKLLVQEDSRASVVVSQVWYKVGSSYEPVGKTGMSHVLEHMMFKGTPDYPSGQFSEIIALNGGSENAFTSKDYTAYFQRIASNHLELCIKLEADRMNNLLLDEEEFKKEIEVVKEERRLRTEDKPTSLTYERFNAEAYKTGAYHHPIIGWMDDLDAMTVADLRDWYQKWYAPNNATLVISGDVDTKEVVRLANKYFGQLKARELIDANITQEPRQTKARYLKVELPAQVPYLLMGYKVPSLTQAVSDDVKADVYALEVLSGLLDGGASARFSKNLLRGEQIASSASAGYNPYERLDTLFLFDGVPTAKNDIASLKAALLAELDKIKTELVSDAELNRVKAQVIASSVYEKDSMFYQAMQLGILETTGLGWHKKDEYLEKVNAVTAAQIQAVAKKYFTEDNVTVTELKPLPMSANKPAAATMGGRHAH